MRSVIQRRHPVGHPRTLSFTSHAPDGVEHDEDAVLLWLVLCDLRASRHAVVEQLDEAGASIGSSTRVVHGVGVSQAVGVTVFKRLQTTGMPAPDGSDQEGALITNWVRHGRAGTG